MTSLPKAIDGKNAGAGTVVLNWAYPDSDGDTVIDALDNCPQLANTDQSDVDGDLLLLQRAVSSGYSWEPGRVIIPRSQSRDGLSKTPAAGVN